jgi:hypothetical protein
VRRCVVRGRVEPEVVLSACCDSVVSGVGWWSIEDLMSMTITREWGLGGEAELA